MLRTPQEVKNEFLNKGLSISCWAIENNFSPQLVYLILNEKRKPTRGMSHDIAVRLGIKEGEIVSHQEFANAVNA